MDKDGYKLVWFHIYCENCKHNRCKDTEEPCNECLSEPTNLFSHKPIKFEEKQAR